MAAALTWASDVGAELTDSDAAGTVALAVAGTGAGVARGVGGGDGLEVGVGTGVLLTVGGGGDGLCEGGLVFRAAHAGTPAGSCMGEGAKPNARTAINPAPSRGASRDSIGLPPGRHHIALDRGRSKVAH